MTNTVSLLQTEKVESATLLADALDVERMLLRVLMQLRVSYTLHLPLLPHRACTKPAQSLSLVIPASGGVPNAIVQCKLSSQIMLQESHVRLPPALPHMHCQTSGSGGLRCFDVMSRMD